MNGGGEKAHPVDKPNSQTKRHRRTDACHFLYRKFFGSFRWFGATLRLRNRVLRRANHCENDHLRDSPKLDSELIPVSFATEQSRRQALFDRQIGCTSAYENGSKS